MKAAVLQEKGQTLQVINVKEPIPVVGGVKVRVTASHVLSFTKNLFSGLIPVPLPTPYIPGPSAIGIVEEIAGDSGGLEKGDKVFCNPYITSKGQTEVPSGILKGWFGLTQNSGGLLEAWKDGSFAEQTVYPLENVTPLYGLENYDDSKLAVINYLCIAYGGLLKGNFRPGQSILINGATGNLGSAAVLTALAMGASSVYAVGRNKEALNHIRSIEPDRIKTIALEGPEEGYKALVPAKAGSVDLVLDALGNLATPFATSSAIPALKNKGIAVFIGGVFADIPLNYYDILAREITVTGSFMYPPSAPGDIINMIRAKTLKLDTLKIEAFKLEQINQAVSRAAELRGLQYCVVNP
ncbi:MAG: zinc-binding dehydrogenase [Bacillota bacterium]|nr:zinc-binding dehydrogenase [Bacillota bacterium]